MMANRMVLAQVMILAVTAAATRMLRGCVNSLLETYLNLLELT